MLSQHLLEKELLNKKMKLSIQQSIVSVFFVIMFFFFSFNFVLASEGFNTSLEQAAQGTGHISDNTTNLEISVMIGLTIKILLGLVGIIFMVLIIYAGYTWMLARGNETESQKAKDTITRAIIGLFIVLAAYAITTFVGKSI